MVKLPVLVKSPTSKRSSRAHGRNTPQLSRPRNPPLFGPQGLQKVAMCVIYCYICIYDYICIIASLHLYSAQFQPGVHLQFVNNILPLEEGVLSTSQMQNPGSNRKPTTREFRSFIHFSKLGGMS